MCTDIIVFIYAIKFISRNQFVDYYTSKLKFFGRKISEKIKITRKTTTPDGIFNSIKFIFGLFFICM